MVIIAILIVFEWSPPDSFDPDLFLYFRWHCVLDGEWTCAGDPPSLLFVTLGKPSEVFNAYRVVSHHHPTPREFVCNFCTCLLRGMRVRRLTYKNDFGLVA